MKKLSVKLKVTLWYTLAMVLVSSVVLIAMSSLSRDMMNRDIASRLIRTVNDNSRFILTPDGQLRDRARYYEQGVHMALFDSDGNLVGGQIPFGMTGDFYFSDNKLRSMTYDGNEYFMYDKQIRLRNQGSMWLKGIISISDESYAVYSVTKNNFIMTIILILLAAGGGYFIISRAFVPVNKISRTAKEISESRDLSQRIKIGNGKDEICQLANTFDEMLDKIEQTFEREKQFTSDASHELRTPVAVILSECEYMLDCANNTEEFKESAESVKRQANKMSKLISELLMISRMDRNTLQLSFESVDISELLSFVCDEQEEIRDESVTLVRNIPQGITAAADRFLLARLFINLISNAYQYSSENGTVWVSLAEDGENVVFKVRDNGIGISEENIPKIWERFYQADPSRTSNDRGSMGLGLSMVKWIAECHGGEVSVESTLGEGSEFTFTMRRI